MEATPVGATPEEPAALRSPVGATSSTPKAAGSSGQATIAEETPSTGEVVPSMALVAMSAPTRDEEVLPTAAEEEEEEEVEVIERPEVRPTVRIMRTRGKQVVVFEEEKDNLESTLNDAMNKIEVTSV